VQPLHHARVGRSIEADRGAPERGPGSVAAMSDESHEQAHTAGGVPVPDPGSGTIAGAEEPMTGPQRTHLQTLCEEAGEPFDDSLSGAEADRRIAELERRLPGRGQD
jgi:DUF3072 family protein